MVPGIAQLLRCREYRAIPHNPPNCHSRKHKMLSLAWALTHSQPSKANNKASEAKAEKLKASCLSYCTSSSLQAVSHLRATLNLPP